MAVCLMALSFKDPLGALFGNIVNFSKDTSSSSL